MNGTLTKDVMPTVFATGDYKLIDYFTSRNKESIANITVYLSLRTTNRDTFGWIRIAEKYFRIFNIYCNLLWIY